MILTPQGFVALVQPATEYLDHCEFTAAIEARSALLRIAHRRKLFEQGQRPNRLFLLRTGEVTLTFRQADGSVSGFRAVPGAFIGLVALASDQPYSMTATASRDSELHAISKEVFREIMDRNPRLSSTVQRIVEESKTAHFLPLRLVPLPIP